MHLILLAMDKRFTDVIQFIQQSRSNAIKAVNTELINLYWNVGAYIKQKLSIADWGDKTVDELALFIQRNNPELKGFSRAGLYRMVQFYETYTQTKFVAPPLFRGLFQLFVFYFFHNGEMVSFLVPFFASL